jgi:hypothetical protein
MRERAHADHHVKVAIYRRRARRLKSRYSDPTFRIYRLLGNPAACRGHKTDGVSPVESRSITPQGGEAAALPFGQLRGSNPVVDIT